MKSQHIHIIGGGVIGLCSAWYLRQKGWDVTVIDKNNLTDGTSFGNAGMVVPSHFTPLAAPGVVWKGLKWMLNKKSPFAIASKINLELLTWLWEFYRASTFEKVAAAAEELIKYNVLSRNLYEEFSNLDAFDFAFEKRGLLTLYQNATSEKEEIEVAIRAQNLGLEAKILSPSQVEQLETQIKIESRGGIYYPSDAHLDPRIFLLNLVSSLKLMGVQFLIDQEITDLQVKNQRVKSITMKSGQKENVDQVLFSAGIWTSQLLKKIGIKILLQAGKGYSFTLQQPKISPSIPTILSDAKVAVTPMSENLRIGGTMEIGSRSTRISKSRVNGILNSLPRYYPDFQISGLINEKIWQGFRPCTPDGLPYLGRLRKYSNAVVATGHAMMGMSLGPATGKIVSQIFSDEVISLNLHFYTPERFN